MRGAVLAQFNTAPANYIRNNSMQGAVAGTPGTAPTTWGVSGTGVTIENIGATSISGIDCIDYRFSGTTGATFGQITLDTGTTIIPASVGQTWAFGVYLALIAGSFTNVSALTASVSQRNTAGTGIASIGVMSNQVGLLTSTLKRAVGAGTLTGADTAYIQPLMAFTWTNGAAIDFTIRIGWPTLELRRAASQTIVRTTGRIARAPRFS